MSTESEGGRVNTAQQLKSRAIDYRVSSLD